MKWLACALALSLCVAPPASAQEAAKAPLVGVLLINTAANPEPVVPLFRNALAALGYVEGGNVRLDFRFAEGHADRFPALAAALVGDKANVIVALGDAATRAAQQATPTIPIVAIADDLVAAGLIQSMARPGGNTTGISILATELDAKKLEILKEIVPAARRFALLRDPASSTEPRLRAIAEMARALGLELQTVDVESPADFAAAFATLRAGGAEALSTSSPRRYWRTSKASSAGLPSNTSSRRSASFARWSRRDASPAMASHGRKCTRCSPPIPTRC